MCCLAGSLMLPPPGIHQALERGKEMGGERRGLVGWVTHPDPLKMVRWVSWDNAENGNIACFLLMTKEGKGISTLQKYTF